MKYKVGDKVILKNHLDTSAWMRGIEVEYQNLNTKIAIIKEVNIMLEGSYSLEEISGLWYDDDIVGTYEPINSRFEILDL
jgi:hypothetical protein